MRTKYTCPTLMHFARYFYAWKLRKSHRVFWKSDNSDSDRPITKYVLVQPLLIPKGGKGGWELSCPFPNWMIFSEMCIRRSYQKVYCHIRYPIKMFQFYQYRFKVIRNRMMSKQR